MTLRVQSGTIVAVVLVPLPAKQSAPVWLPLATLVVVLTAVVLIVAVGGPLALIGLPPVLLACAWLVWSVNYRP